MFLTGMIVSETLTREEFEMMVAQDARSHKENPVHPLTAGFVRRLRDNSDAYRFGRITWEEFDNRNVITWMAIECRGLAQEVTKALDEMDGERFCMGCGGPFNGASGLEWGGRCLRCRS